MKVCMISANLPSHVGGVESFVDGLSKFLLRAGMNITIIGRDHEDFVKENGTTRTIGIRPFNYMPRALGSSHNIDYVYDFKVWRKMRHYNFDVIHGGNQNCYFPSLFGKGAPLIGTFHGTLAGGYSKLKARLLPYQYFISTIPEKIAARKCDVAVACSQEVKRELLTFYGADYRKIKVIYNGVDIKKFRIQDRGDARRKLGLHQEEKYGIWIGTNPYLKGLNIAVEAVRRSIGVKLLVVGVRGKSDQKVVYFGQISNLAKRLLLYNCANFMIHPTLYDGFPIVTLEAMACGLPIVISKECPTKEIIKEGLHGFVVNERTPEKYAEKIEILLENERTYQEFSINCRELATKYSWENQGKKYLSIYEKLA
jgi:glycosyltransferase involved in cell wall biosynthesis